VLSGFSYDFDLSPVRSGSSLAVDVFRHVNSDILGDYDFHDFDPL
jgi:hypothetical protein